MVSDQFTNGESWLRERLLLLGRRQALQTDVHELTSVLSTFSSVIQIVVNVFVSHL